MAAISANGGREVARFERQNRSDGGYTMTWTTTLVATSDGRLLSKTDDSGYTVVGKIKDAKSKTADQINAIATAYAERRGFHGVPVRSAR